MVLEHENKQQNFGNGYDPQLGIFTCPKSGVYIFTITIMSERGKRTETKLFVNGTRIAFSYVAGPTPAFRNTGSRSLIVHLHSGESG